MVIYSFLNIVIFEYECKLNNFLKKSYADKSIGDNLMYFQHIWTGLLQHLRDDGWPESFLPYADALMAKRRVADATAGEAP